MTDHAYDRSEEDDRDYLKATEVGDLRVAVRRLVAERDEARAAALSVSDRVAFPELDAAEARVTELEARLANSVPRRYDA